MATIIHFDISADNPVRCKEFFEKIFNWSFQLLPVPMNYYLIETKDLEGKSGVGGGMSKRENETQAGITNFIGVASIDQTLKKIEELGGTITQPKQFLPGFGYLATCLDTEKKLIGLFEEEKSMK